MIYGHVAETLDRDPALREAVMVLRYEDLCDKPAETMRQMMQHCRLEAINETILSYAGRIRQPHYYQPEYSSNELAAIEAETQGTRPTRGY